MGEIRFVGTGETRGYPYPVCKKTLFLEKRQGAFIRAEEGRGVRGVNRINTVYQLHTYLFGYYKVGLFLQQKDPNYTRLV